jgi:hypothetical protein
VRRRLARRPVPDADLLAWRTVDAPTAPTAAQVAEYLRDLGALGQEPGRALADELYAVLGPHPPTGPEATAALRTLDRRHPPPEIYPELVAWAVDDRACRALVKKLRVATPQTASTAVAGLDALPDRPPPLHVTEAVGALLEAGPPVGAAVVAGTRSAVRRALVDEVRCRCSSDPQDLPERAVALAFLLLVGTPRLGHDEGNLLRSHLAPVVRALDKPRRGVVQSLIGESFRQSWWTWLKALGDQARKDPEAAETPAPTAPEAAPRRWMRLGRKG